MKGLHNPNLTFAIIHIVFVVSYFLLEFDDDGRRGGRGGGFGPLVVDQAADVDCYVEA